MRYLLAIIAPPLACLHCNRFFSFIISIPLTFMFWIPGIIHALLVVQDYHRQQEMKLLKETVSELKKLNSGKAA